MPDIKAFSVAQVKEKFGTLRYYTSGSNDKIRQLIHDAEERSAETCEVCGKPGKLITGGWLKTLCTKHNEKASGLDKAIERIENE